MDFLNTPESGTLVALLVAYSFNVVGALALLALGWFVAGWAGRSTRRFMDRIKRIDPTLKPIAANFVRYTILVLTLIGVLAQFGIQTASILAVIGAASLAVGLALQGTLTHVASGVIILLIRPFSVGDYIDADGIAGTVREIGLFATELETFDGVYVMVPNGIIIGRSIKNFTRLPTRRVDVAVGVAYGDNLEQALATALSVLKEDSRILPTPEPQAMVMALADSAVNINLRCWTGRDNYWDVFFDVQKNVKIRLEAEGFTIPFPQRDVHVIQDAKAEAAHSEDAKA
jgi:small conductance mechanosensitive channel